MTALMDDLARWLGAQLDEDRAALLRYRDGHDGPCINYDGQDPADYDGYDSCVLHLEAAKGTPYRCSDFGLREIDAKRQLLALHRPVQRRSTGSTGGTIVDCQVCDHFPARYPCTTLRLLALPYADRPAYRPEWAPGDQPDPSSEETT